MKEPNVSQCSIGRFAWNACFNTKHFELEYSCLAPYLLSFAECVKRSVLSVPHDARRARGAAANAVSLAYGLGLLVL